MIGITKTGIRRLTTSSPSISSTLLLSRNPVVTADVPKFESQYRQYQKELWKRLMWTFPKWFYFREGTLAEQRYRELNKNPVSDNSQIEFPRGRPQIRHNRDRRFKQELRLPKTYKEVDQLDGLEEKEKVSSGGLTEDDLARKIIPRSRITKADTENDLTSLERKLSRTLYLVVGEEGFSFPNFTVGTEKVALHELAEKGLYEIGGEKINYFNVSNTPCHVNDKKEYFIKSHILSGEFVPKDEGLKFVWLTKEELKDRLDGQYYEDIEHLLSDV